MSKSKLIIHETDAHGCGFVYYKGECYRYTYDDGRWGDVHNTVAELIKIGFIKYEDVAIFTNEDEIYKYVEMGLNVNE